MNTLELIKLRKLFPQLRGLCLDYIYFNGYETSLARRIYDIYNCENIIELHKVVKYIDDYIEDNNIKKIYINKHLESEEKRLLNDNI